MEVHSKRKLEEKACEGDPPQIFRLSYLAGSYLRTHLGKLSHISCRICGHSVDSSDHIILHSAQEEREVFGGTAHGGD